MKTRLLLRVPVLAIVLLVIFGALRVQAQSQQSKYSLIVQRIAERFGLEESDVQAVFDEAHQER